MKNNEIGLNAIRKKTERAKTIEPSIISDTVKSLPDEKVLSLPNRRLTSKDLPKSIRIPQNTHTAITTIATLEDKKIYEVINTLVENYIQQLPHTHKKIVRSSIKATTFEGE